MRRGDIVLVALAGDHGKPRPAVVIQSDWLEHTDSVLICLITTTKREAPLYRLDIEAGVGTGLRAPSQIMIDKIMAAPRVRCSPPVGRVPDEQLGRLSQGLALVVGLGD